MSNLELLQWLHPLRLRLVPASDSQLSWVGSELPEIWRPEEVWAYLGQVWPVAHRSFLLVARQAFPTYHDKTLIQRYQWIVDRFEETSDVLTQVSVGILLWKSWTGNSFRTERAWSEAWWCRQWSRSSRRPSSFRILLTYFVLVRSVYLCSLHDAFIVVILIRIVS